MLTKENTPWILLVLATVSAGVLRHCVAIPDVTQTASRGRAFEPRERRVEKPAPEDDAFSNPMNKLPVDNIETKRKAIGAGPPGSLPNDIAPPSNPPPSNPGNPPSSGEPPGYVPPPADYYPPSPPPPGSGADYYPPAPGYGDPDGGVLPPPQTYPPPGGPEGGEYVPPNSGSGAVGNPVPGDPEEY